jgi:hypothetical protein
MDVESVPHAAPLTDEELNQRIFDAFTEFIKQVQTVGQSIAADFGIAGSDIMALLKLEAPMTMKELGQKMGCDPSFVTAIADALEKHLLARREPSQRDRRSKNLCSPRRARPPGTGSSANWRPGHHGARWTPASASACSPCCRRCSDCVTGGDCHNIGGRLVSWSGSDGNLSRRSSSPLMTAPNGEGRDLRGTRATVRSAQKRS